MTITEHQPLVALRKANHARSEKARLRHAIRTAGRQGAVIAADAVLEATAPITFERLLTTVPTIGDVRAARMLRVARIAPTLRVDSLLVDRARRLALHDLLMERAAH